MNKNYIKNRLITILTREVGYQVSLSLRKLLKSKNRQKEKNITYNVDYALHNDIDDFRKKNVKDLDNDIKNK